MAATPYTGQLIFVAADGYRYNVPVTASDVAAGFWLPPSGASDIQLPAGHGAVTLKDVILSAAGVDTTKAQIFVNEKTTGEEVLGSANIGSVYNRQYMSSPITFAAGSRIRFKQVA